MISREKLEDLWQNSVKDARTLDGMQVEHLKCIVILLLDIRDLLKVPEKEIIAEFITHPTQ